MCLQYTGGEGREDGFSTIMLNRTVRNDCKTYDHCKCDCAHNCDNDHDQDRGTTIEDILVLGPSRMMDATSTTSVCNSTPPQTIYVGCDVVSQGNNCRFRAGVLGGASTPFVDVALPIGSNFTVRALFNGSVATGWLEVGGLVRAMATIALDAKMVFVGMMAGSMPGSASQPSACIFDFSIFNASYFSPLNVPRWASVVDSGISSLVDGIRGSVEGQQAVCPQGGLSMVQREFTPAWGAVPVTIRGQSRGESQNVKLANRKGGNIVLNIVFSECNPAS